MYLPPCPRVYKLWDIVETRHLLDTSPHSNQVDHHLDIQRCTFDSVPSLKEPNLAEFRGKKERSKVHENGHKKILGL